MQHCRIEPTMRSSLKYWVCVCVCVCVWARSEGLNYPSALYLSLRLCLSLLVFLDLPHTNTVFLSWPFFSPFISALVFHVSVSRPTPSKHAHGGRCSCALYTEQVLWFQPVCTWNWKVTVSCYSPASSGASHRYLTYWPTYLSFLCVCPHKWKKSAFPAPMERNCAGSRAPIGCQYVFPRPLSASEKTKWTLLF